MATSLAQLNVSLKVYISLLKLLHNRPLICTGHVSKFSDVKSAKEKSKPKPKDEAVSARPQRSRGGLDVSRGAPRGRSERGRGGFRGGRGATHSTAPGPRAAAAATSAATGDSNAWGDTTAATDGAASSGWDTATETTAKVATPEPAKPSAPAEPGKKTWAQMFAKPVAPPIPIAQKPTPEATPTAEPDITPSETSDFVEVTHEDAQPEEPAQPAADETPGHDPPQIVEPEDPIIQLTPSKDQLTKENVEHLPDVAQPAPTGTAASTVESSRGPDSVTPSVSGQPIAHAPIGRPLLGGFQTTAYKATAGGSRSASFNRRLAEQQEAVVMPGNHAVDRTAVQFGSLGLNGDALDVDEDREELETRAQPPQHSPVAQPRASLPPVPRQQAAASETPLQESPAVTKPAPGLPQPPVAQQSFAQQSPSTSTTQAQPGPQSGQAYAQFGRYGQADTSAQKQYDPFGQQLPQQGGYVGYPSHSQAPEQQSSQSLGGYSSSANDYSSYYTADQRNAYSSYYNNSYGQHGSGAQQDAGASQQRTGSAFGAAGDSSYSSNTQSSQVSTSRERKGSIERLLAALEKPHNILKHNISNTLREQISSRYGDNQQSGNNTPNPTGTHQHGGQAAGAQHGHQAHAQGQHGGYPYAQHPYYNSPYYSAYMNQYSPYGQQGFGQGPYNKGYNQPHQGYGGGYDQHSSSPFGRDTGLSGGLGDYGRSGSAQPSQSAQSGGSGFGGGNDSFGRSQGGYQGQSSAYGGAQSGQQGSSDEALKPFGDTKSGPAPSPSALGQPGRPGSATNTAGQASSGLPPPQSHQQGFGGYPSHSQYGGGLGGLGGGHTAGAQGGHQQGYGSNYGAGFGGGSNYGSYGAGRGGWGANYGGH
jgi:hypothetical protein